MRARYPPGKHTPLTCSKSIVYQLLQEKLTFIEIVQSLPQNHFLNAAVGLPPEKTRLSIQHQICPITKHKTWRVPVKISRKVKYSDIVFQSRQSSYDMKIAKIVLRERWQL